MVEHVQFPRAESRFAGWIAPLWVLALVGILFIPTEYRGGASSPHSHALLQLLLDAQDSHFAHTHSYPTTSQAATDWLDPEVQDATASQEQVRPDIGQQQERASTVSIMTFLVLLPALPMLTGEMPRIAPATRRLVGRAPCVLSPPPRVSVTTA